MSFWRKLFRKQQAANQSTAGRAPQPVTATQPLSTLPKSGSPTDERRGCRADFDTRLAACPERGSSEMRMHGVPEWFAVLQAHVTAVQLNDRAVQWFREGRLDDAIAELRRGLAANPQYATGHSNLGFLFLRKGQLDRAVECLLRALEVDPHHRDAPDHLFDVLSALVDELVHIGFTDGFLSMQPGGKFDDHNRHMRTRELGALIAKIGQRGLFKVDGRALDSVQLLRVVIDGVQQKMGYHSKSTSLTFAWDGIDGWYPSPDSILRRCQLPRLRGASPPPPLWGRPLPARNSEAQ